MEIAVLSTSFPRELAAYFTSRMIVGRVVFLWLILSACVLVLTREISLASAVLRAVLVAALVVQFRLWDDLVDRDHDTVLQPQRVLVATGHVMYFSRFCCLMTLSVAAAIGFVFGIVHLLIYGLLLVAISLLYAIPRAGLPHLLRAHLVLLKYPVFIWLCVSDVNPLQWVYLSTIVYLAVCMFEIMSDAGLRNGVAWRAVVSIEVVAFVVLLIFPIWIFL